jgi:hypothetical protein
VVGWTSVPGQRARAPVSVCGQRRGAGTADGGQLRAVRDARLPGGDHPARAPGYRCAGVPVTREEIRRLIDGPEAPGWDERDAALLRVVDELDATSGLSDATWALLRARFDDRQLIEIPVVVGNYKLVAYLLNSLQIQPPDDLPRLPPTIAGER